MDYNILQEKSLLYIPSLPEKYALYIHIFSAETGLCFSIFLLTENKQQTEDNRSPEYTANTVEEEVLPP